MLSAASSRHHHHHHHSSSSSSSSIDRLSLYDSTKFHDSNQQRTVLRQKRLRRGRRGNEDEGKISEIRTSAILKGEKMQSSMEKKKNVVVKDIVLVGGGHAHVFVLKRSR